MAAPARTVRSLGISSVLLGNALGITRRMLPANCINCNRIYVPFGGGPFKRLASTVSGIMFSIGGGGSSRNTRSGGAILSDTTHRYPLSYAGGPHSNRKLGLYGINCSHVRRTAGWSSQTQPVQKKCQLAGAPAVMRGKETLLLQRPSHLNTFVRLRVTEASLSGVAPAFTVMKFDKEGNVMSFEKKKTELCQEFSLQARDLRFQHSTSLTARNNCIIIRMETLKAVVTPACLLVLDFRGLGLERWLVLELAPQLASHTHTLPFEFRALEAILQHRVNTLQARLNEVHPVILDTLESLVDPKLLSADRSKLHVLLQSGKSLSELETDIKVFKDSLLKILDEDEMVEELCLTKWSDPRVFEESSLGIDHAEEMELLLENYFMQAEELGNEARELKSLIDDSESIIFINLDSHRNVMMRLNLQLTMGTFSLSLFGLMGVAFGMNLASTFEEDPRAFWLVTGFMFLGSGLIWRRLLSFLGRHLEPSIPPQIPPVWKRSLKSPEMKTGVR